MKKKAVLGLLCGLSLCLTSPAITGAVMASEIPELTSEGGGEQPSPRTETVDTGSGSETGGGNSGSGSETGGGNSGSETGGGNGGGETGGGSGSETSGGNSGSETDSGNSGNTDSGSETGGGSTESGTDSGNTESGTGGGSTESGSTEGGNTDSGNTESGTGGGNTESGNTGGNTESGNNGGGNNGGGNNSWSEGNWGNNGNGDNGTTVEETVTQAPVINYPSLLEVELKKEGGDSSSSVKISYPSYGLHGKSKESYPKLAQVLEMKSNLGLDVGADYAKRLEELAAAGGSDLEYTQNVQFKRADSSTTGLLFTTYYNDGQNGGEYTVDCRNFDSQTGEFLMLSKVVTDIPAFEELVKKEVEKHYPDFDASKIDLEKDTDSNIWIMGYNGITLYLKASDQAHGPEDYLSVVIPFAGYDSLFNNAYTLAPKSYAMELTRSLPDYNDLDGNGSLEQLLLNAEISINSTSQEVDFEENWDDAVYLHMSSGKNYIYLLSDEENLIRVYDFAEGKVNFIDQTERTYGENVLITDPNAFLLTEEGKTEGSQKCKAGEDGMPVAY